MPKSQLPQRASLEYLKRRAKELLIELRRRDPRSSLRRSFPWRATTAFRAGAP
jgi:hypothetical protein